MISAQYADQTDLKRPGGSKLLVRGFIVELLLHWLSKYASPLYRNNLVYCDFKLRNYDACLLFISVALECCLHRKYAQDMSRRRPRQMQIILLDCRNLDW